MTNLSPPATEISSPLVYTIVTKNHFHLAAGLEQSFRTANPHGRFLLVVADADDPISGQPNWDWLHPAHKPWQDSPWLDWPLQHSLGQDSPGQHSPGQHTTGPLVGGTTFLRSAAQLIGDSLWSLAFQYSPLELTCCLKGLIANQLLLAGETQLLYLDADTRLFVPAADCLAELSHGGGVLLTPHCYQPLPADQHYPSNVDLLRSGAFNAGVLGFSTGGSNGEEVMAFLRWWTNCCAHDCIVDPRNGLFVDQRWLDQAPAMFSAVRISKQIGLNVGYWNLHERVVVRDLNGHYVFRRTEAESWIQQTGPANPLQVIHFSGAMRAGADGSSMQHRLSMHQNRHSLREVPAVAKLLSDYWKSWPQQHWQHYADQEYGFARFADGCLIEENWREAYRQNIEQLRIKNPNPFEAFASAQQRIQLEQSSVGLMSGRFQFQLDEMHRRIESLKLRLDRLPWRQLANTAKQWHRQWFKKAG